MPSLRVAIDARVPDGLWGGVQQVVLGLATGLGEITDGDEFLFLVYEGESAWLQKYMTGNCGLVEVRRRFGKTRRRRAFERVTSAAPSLAKLAQRGAPALGRLAAPIPSSDGTLEALRVDLVHFTTQQAFLTGTPSIYQPHDLQHVHLPGYFSPLQLRYRDTAYRAFCNQARYVSVMTDWGRRDLCDAFGVDRQRVAVIPWAPVTGFGQDRDTGGEPREVFALPERFLVYPAQTWPHKNHLGLLEALAQLRDRGLTVPLVCTGVQNEHFPAIRRRLRELHLEGQVQFLGYVTEAEMARLYRTGMALVFPSRFEGWGLPVVEAFAHGLPVIASNATVLPEVAGEAAIFFDPDDIPGMAQAIAKVWVDDRLRADLVARGRERVSALSWGKTARTFRALYRKVAGQTVSEEDRALLAPPTLLA
ncbi:MAG: glycosyltransferase family 4 protein [Candidatus Limnocylindrales bacterium]